MTRTVGNEKAIEASLRDAAGALALAGHSIDDLQVQELVRLAASGEIPIAEMLNRVNSHFTD